jgi:hypothetical protein
VTAGGHPGKRGDMTDYLIAFNDEWVPDHTVEELREKSKTVRAPVAEMKAAGAFIFTGGLDDAAPVLSVEASNGTPLFTDGPFVNPRSEHWTIAGAVPMARRRAASSTAASPAHRAGPWRRRQTDDSARSRASSLEGTAPPHTCRED